MSGGACNCTSCIVGEKFLGTREDATMLVTKICLKRQVFRYEWSKRSKLYLKFIRKGRFPGTNGNKKASCT